MALDSVSSNDRLIIANCSGFFGDRFSAAEEMVQGGPIHFLTGDYLAELTMAILLRQQLKEAQEENRVLKKAERVFPKKK